MALGMISGAPCEITVDTGSNISIVRPDLSVVNQDLFQSVHSYIRTVTGEQASIHGKGRLELGITSGDSSGAVGCCHRRPVHTWPGLSVSQWMLRDQVLSTRFP